MNHRAGITPEWAMREFGPGLAVVDNKSGRIGRVEAVTKKGVLVTFQNAHHFMSLQVFYPMPDGYRLLRPLIYEEKKS